MWSSSATFGEPNTISGSVAIIGNPRLLSSSVSGVRESGLPISASNQILRGFTTATAATMLALSNQLTPPTFVVSDPSAYGQIFAPHFISTRMPAIFHNAHVEMESYRQLGDEWDGIGSARPKSADIDLALSFLRALPADVPAPVPTISFDGVVGWFWEHAPLYATVSFACGHPYAYFAKNKATGHKVRGRAVFDGCFVPEEFLHALGSA